MDFNKIYNLDCLEGLKQLEDNSIDAIISDPPYQLSSITKRFGKEDSAEAQYGTDGAFQRVSSGFMGKEWDILPSVEILKECLRVLKTGAWALWMMTPRQDSQLEFLLRLREAGFNISFSSIEYIYASGFPKAADLSLLADKKACREELTQKLCRNPTEEEFNEAWENWREKVAVNPNSRPNTDKSVMDLGWTGEGKVAYETNPHSLEAKALDGSYSGFQPKPAREFVLLSQKPIVGKTYLEQALLHLKDSEHNQLGGTWLDDGRIPYKNEKDKKEGQSARNSITKDTLFPIGGFDRSERSDITGRFPANLLVSDNAIDIGIIKISTQKYKLPDKGGSGASLVFEHKEGGIRGYDDSSDLSRYFDLDFWFEKQIEKLPKEQQKIFPFLYVPKASKSERNKGLKEGGTGSNTYNRKCLICDKWERKQGLSDNYTCYCENPKWEEPKGNIHPTVKSIKLMTYLITLTTRENDIVLDPFIGSGTTAISSYLLKRRYIGFEREKEYYDIAIERIKHYEKQRFL